MYSLICEEFSKVNQVLFSVTTNLNEEGDRLPSVQQAVVVSQSKIHHLMVAYISNNH